MQRLKHSQHILFLWVYLSIGALILIAIASFNLVIDPLQFYRSAWYSPIFTPNQRFQNPGLAKNYRYDTVVIGTSHTENFSPNYIHSQLGWNALKLSIKGSTAKEQTLILQKALNTGQVKNVIWGIELSSFIGNPDRFNEQDGTFPEYLYNETLLTHLIYLLSWDTTVLSADALRGRGLHDLETLNTWHDKYTFSYERVQEAWRESAIKSQQISVQTSSVNIEQMMKSLNTNLVQIIVQNPNVRFFLFFPPYSILAYIPYDNCDNATVYKAFMGHLQFREAVTHLLLPLGNVELFDFQTVTAITHNLSNYKDLTHYSIAINEYIIRSLKRDQHRLTTNNTSQSHFRLGTQIQAALEQSTTENSIFYHCSNQNETTSDTGIKLK